MSSEFQRCQRCGFEYDYLNADFLVCAECVAEDLSSKHANDPATSKFSEGQDLVAVLELLPNYGEYGLQGTSGDELLDISFPDDLAVGAIALGHVGEARTATEHALIGMGFSTRDALKWSETNFSLDDIVVFVSHKISARDATKLRDNGMSSVEIAEFSSWIGKIEPDDIRAWSHNGFRPEELSTVLLLVKSQLSHSSGSKIRKILGHEGLELIRLLHEAGIPINPVNVKRWKTLDVQSVTPTMLLSLIDRGFANAEEAAGYECVAWDYELLVNISKGLGLDTPQELLAHLEVDGLEQLLLMQDLGLSLELSWEWAIRGFLADEVNEWLSAVDEPTIAVEWANMGFGADDLRNWKALGILDPSVAQAWILAGFDHRDCQDWQDVGLSSSEAARWKAAGVSPLVAKRRAAQGIKPC